MKTFFHSKWIQIQQSVTIVNLETHLLIKGPLGASFLKFPKKLVFEKNNIQGYRFFGCSEQKNLVLTYYSLLINAIKGVYLGYSEILIINGVGWRISIQDKVLIFSLGFSHSIFYTLKNDIEVILYDKQCFKIFGLNSQFVQQVVADLCRLRLFNVYKGKGVYKQGEVFSLKESSKSKA